MVDVDGFDDLDRAMVHALQIDGRAPFRRIGDVLGVSDQTVARRYARLRRMHAVHVVGLADFDILQEAQWIVRVRATPDAAARIAEALARRADTSWINVCSGGTDIVCAAHGSSVDPLLEVLLRTRQVVDVHADRVLRIFYGGRAEPFTKHGTLNAAQVARLSEHVPDPGSTRHEPDDVDRRLLEALRHEGRAPVEELMSAARISATSVRRRVHALRAEGLLHLDVDVDVALLRLPMRTLLWVGVAAAMLDTAGAALAAHDEVAYVAATTGPTALFASVTTADAETLYRYLNTRVAELPGALGVETATVLRHVKGAATSYGPGLSTNAARRRGDVEI